MTYYMFKRGIGLIADTLANKISKDGIESASVFDNIFKSVLSMFGAKYWAAVLKYENGKTILEVHANIHLWRVKVKREVKSC